MANIRAFIRTTKKDKTNIRFRLSEGRLIQLFYVSDISIIPEFWDADKQTIKARILIPPAERNAINTAINNIKTIILQAYDNIRASNDELSSSNLSLYIDKIAHPNQHNLSSSSHNNTSLISLFSVFIVQAKVSYNRNKSYKTVFSKLERFQLYYNLAINKRYKLDINTLTAEILNEFERYLFDEVSIVARYPQLLDTSTKTKPPKPKGQNAITCILTILRTFNNWCIKNNYTTNYPFRQFKLKPEVYGTPFYLTNEERNHLYNFDLSDYPELLVQRDIFIFQCLTACRVSDLYCLTKHNVINEAIEYIAKKKKQDPITLRVPLNSITRAIIFKYKDYNGDKLFPYTSMQQYNRDIKKFFYIAGLDRMITILNPTTRLQEQKPLYEIASTHTARKTFIGNIYKQVQDPNLIGSLTGHSEGSRAFSRYREIDENIKQNLVNLLE